MLRHTVARAAHFPSQPARHRSGLSRLGEAVPKTRYPLEFLLRQRQQLLDEQARQLARRQREKVAAGTQRERAEQTLAAHDQHTHDGLEHEQQRVEQGLASVAHLQAIHLWHQGRQQQAQQLGRQAQLAEQHERAAIDNEQAARGHLARAQAQAELVQRHQQRFDAEQQRAEQERQDDEAHDQATNRYVRSRY